MRSPTLLPMRMNAADTSASSAIADWTPLTVVSRSCTTAEIDTFMSDVSTTSTNIAIANNNARRRSLPACAPTLVRASVIEGESLHSGPGTTCKTLGVRAAGNSNTATGFAALNRNTIGQGNTANGSNALDSNIDGDSNTASGFDALGGNTTGSNNTATGWDALANNTTGSKNTAVGAGALVNATGDSNIALGADAGRTLTTGDGNIYIGNIGSGGPVESQTICIGRPRVC